MPVGPREIQAWLSSDQAVPAMSRWIHSAGGRPGVSPTNSLRNMAAGGGTGVAGGAGVADVGDLALDLLAVVVRAGHAPELFTGEGGAFEELRGGLVAVGEEASVEQAEGDADGPGEGGVR